MSDFIEFIRKQGVVGLATGFILGGATSELVKAIVNDIINPVIGAILGSLSGLEDASFPFFGATILWGHLLSIVINFLVIVAVVYGMFRILKLDRLDKKVG
ncbi:MAG: MscL family protein [Patescibacteria group bacterium]